MSLDIIKKYNIKAKKAFGQNFLVNNKILEQISDVTSLQNENIVEVGPGYGALTQKILEKNPKNLNLIELDNDMVKILNDRIKNNELNISSTNININNIDVLKYKPDFKDYIVVANIPYYITSPILRHFLYNLEYSPKKMIILLQKEVGDKILNDKKHSFLSLLLAKKAKISNQLFVDKKYFNPSPKVDSTVLLFERIKTYDYLKDEIFLDIIKKAFSNPRKKLLKNLSTFDKEKLKRILSDMGFSESVRPGELNIENWFYFIKNII